MPIILTTAYLRPDIMAMATAAKVKKLVWRCQNGFVERRGGLRRTLSTADRQIPTKSIDVPEISLAVKADTSREPLLPSPPPSLPLSTPLSTPVSYYLDTHSVVLQLQGTG